MPGTDSLGLWLFLAVVVVATTARQMAATRQLQRTLRLSIEKRQPLEPGVVEHLMRNRQRDSVPAAAIAVFGVGVGLPVMGYIVELGGDSGAFYPLLGAGMFIVMIGCAQLIVWGLTRRGRVPIVRR